MKEEKVQRCICIRERKEEKQSGKQGKRFIKEGDTGMVHGWGELDSLIEGQGE